MPDAAPSDLAARDYVACVTNPNDGVEIAVTVLQPALAAGETAPLILHGHGFGGSRLTGRELSSRYEALSGGDLPSTEAARRAAATGYFVLSFDQRGFGESGGHVHIMDPTLEGSDIRTLLDWAEQEMAHGERITRRNGRIVAGGLGLSYGGGFQLTGAAIDARFDAVVPTATWHDLRYSLAPDNVVKTVWGAALVALGLPTSGVKLDPIMYHALLQGLASPLTGRGISQHVADRLYAHSPIAAFANHGDVGPGSEPMGPPGADALLIQGVGDTLFNLNEALANLRALHATGRDAHLLVMRHGHSLPFLEDINRIAYETDATLHRGAHPIETWTIELAYLDWKLKGQADIAEMPRVMVILDDRTLLAFDDLPVAGPADRPITGRAATGGLDLLKSVLAEDTLAAVGQLVSETAANARQRVRDWFAASDSVRDVADTALVARLVNALPAHRVDELASGGVFLPIMDVEDDDHALVGIPRLDVSLSGGGLSPVVFVGLGIQRSGRDTTILINDQIRPLRGAGDREVDLNGVAQRLAAGDRVGLLVYGYHPQFLASFTGMPGHVDVRGHVGLPLIRVTDHAAG